jgi:hypothetical protein
MLPLACAQSDTSTWISATIDKVTVAESPIISNWVHVRIMRRKSNAPHGAIGNEAATAVFAIPKDRYVNALFSPEALENIQNHSEPGSSTAGIAVAIGLTAEIHVERVGDGAAFATLVFNTFGGGYFLQRSTELQFQSVETIELPLDLNPTKPAH